MPVAVEQECLLGAITEGKLASVRGLLDRFADLGFRVDLEVVRAGYDADDDDGRLVTASEVRQFLAPATEPELSAVREAASDEALAERLHALPFDPALREIADRKWSCLMLTRRLARLDGDPVEALIQIEEHWIDWRYPGPHGAIVGTQWQDAERTLERVLAIDRAWLDEERAAILANGG